MLRRLLTCCVVTVVELLFSVCVEPLHSADVVVEPGWIGGGGPASPMDYEKPTDEERHLPDTDHSVT